MDPYADARMKMVEDQLVRRGIVNQKVLEAMRKIQRHLFVNENEWDRAYDDTPLSIPCSQTISQPYMVGLMTELIDPDKTKIVLEIGTGSGYQAAVLAETCKQVYSIERHQELAEQANNILKKLGYENVEIKTDDGTVGWKEKAPFDAIIVTAGAPEVPDILVEQLNEQGKMVIPIGTHYRQNLELVQKRGDSYIKKTICGCIFVPLIGRGGWAE
jgi:protein-L-isoaspartate(D-aspartate) O-methyltransferase